MLTQLGQASVNLFDNIIVGRLLGANALASVSLGNSVFFSVFVFALGISLAIPPLVSEANSQNNHSQINKVFSHGFVINLAIGILLAALLLLISPLMKYAQQPPEIIPDAMRFLNIMAISIIPFMIFQTMREVSEGLSYTIGVTVATVAANLINIALNYTFIEGLFGITPMGVAGSAYATLISRFFIIIFLYFIMRRESKTQKYLKEFSLKLEIFSKEMFRKMLKIGVPIAFQLFFEVSTFAGASFICGLVSATDVAAHQVAMTMVSFTYNLCVGFSVASTIMVGNKFGERDFLGARKIGVNNIKIAFIFMSLCCLIFILGKDILPTFYTKPGETNVVVLASMLLIIASLFQLSDGIQVVALGSLRGLQDVKIPSIFTFIAYWVITIPLGYYLCYVRGMGAVGMWIAFGMGLTISAVLLVRRFLILTSRSDFASAS